MILCLDCGNTTIKIGLYDDDKLVNKFIIKTVRNKTSDEYALIFSHMFESEAKIDGAIISSVVPLLTKELFNAIKRSFNVEALILGKELKTKLPIKIDSPNELGTDLLAGAVGAKNKFGYPVVIADLGTATKLYVVDKSGNFIGGVITCGMEVSLKALVDSTSQLLETSITRPKKIIGKNTINSIQSGIVLGQAYMVSEFTRRMENELGYKLERVLTGGFSKEIKSEIVCFHYEEHLVLDGLYEIYKLNARCDI